MPSKLTFFIEFAYLKYEWEGNFTWTLNRLKELFTYKKLISKVMVIDQELALMNVVEVVFLITNYILCTFLVMKNVGVKCKLLVEENKQDSIIGLWSKIAYSKLEIEYEWHLQHFELVCNDIVSLLIIIRKHGCLPIRKILLLHRPICNDTHLRNTSTNR